MSNLSMLIVALGWLAAWGLWGRPRRVGELGGLGDPGGPGGGQHRTFVIVPARNEARTLPGLLSDLTADLPGATPRTLIVVDDGSTDGTPEIARTFAGVTVVAAGPLPPGWTGKNNACASGVRLARSLGARAEDHLVFIDADVRLEPGALDRVENELGARRAGVVSVQPWHDMRRPYERLSILFNLVAPMGVGIGVRGEAAHRRSACFGPLIVTTVEAYDAVGGHDAVAGEVIEDIALGQRFADAGRPVSLLLGDGGVRYRMYPEGLRQLVEGWSKNMASGAGVTPPVRLLGVALWISALGAAAIGAASLTVAGATAMGLMATQLWWLSRRVGRLGALGAAAYPALLIGFVVIMARSILLTRARGAVAWRGRSIPVGPAPTRNT